MIKPSLKFLLVGLNLWLLHGIDIQYYLMSDNRMFEIQLFLSVISNLFLLLVMSEKHG